jgi:uncharacterized protein (TIGR03435 family)
MIGVHEGRFDFQWSIFEERSAARRSEPAHAATSKPVALQDQLGWKLTASKGPVDVLVIESGESPSGN